MTNNNKSLKRAFGTVVVALVLCFAMLLGTTYALFTDSVASGNNVITSGNLDIALDYWNGNEWTTVEGATDLFTGNLWEPGHAEVVYLKVSNEGSLALQYLLGMNIVSEIGSVNVSGAAFNLSDYIEFGVVTRNGETEPFEDREDALAAVEQTSAKISSGYMAYGTMDPNCEQYVAVVVYMPTSVGNEANYMKGKTAPTIEFGISVLAMQCAYEFDSFGRDYDAGVWGGNADTTWYKNDKAVTEYTLTSAAQLAGLAKLVNEGNNMSDITIKLGRDIDLMNLNWTPIGTPTNAFAGTFDGCGHTVSNLKVAGETYVGLFGRCFNGVTLKNVNIDGASVMGTHYVGALVGHIYGNTANCTVTNATVIGYALDDETNDGSKVGGIIGYNGEKSYSITGNTLTNSTVRGCKDVGGILGVAQTGNTVSGNTVSNVTVSSLIVKEDYATAGAIVSGRIKPENITIKDNTETDVTVKIGDYQTVYSSYELDQVFSANDGPYTIYFMTDVALENEGLLTESYLKNNGMTIDGNGNTVVFTVTDANSFGWGGEMENIPQDSVILGSADGSEVEVSNLTITGTMQPVMLGIYRGSKDVNYNSVLNNVNVVNADVVPCMDDPAIAVAMFVYGKAEFKDCMVAGSTMSEKYGDDGYAVYDLAVVNYSTATLDGSDAGSVYLWEHANLELKNGSSVDCIAIKEENATKAIITVDKTSTVGTLDLSGISKKDKCTITIDGTVNHIIANGVEYDSIDDWFAAK